jgi:hypothetical protein
MIYTALEDHGVGGYNSTRWGWHDKAATVEASLRLPIKDVLAGGPGMRSMYWTRRGEPAGYIRYTVAADMVQMISWRATVLAGVRVSLQDLRAQCFPRRGFARPLGHCSSPRLLLQT